MANQKVLDVAQYFSDDPSRLEEMHAPMVNAVSAAYPGLLHAELARLPDGSFLDVIAWDSPESASRGINGERSVPEYIEFSRYISKVLWSHSVQAVSVPGQPNTEVAPAR